MLIGDHVRRVLAFERAFSRLDPMVDTQLYIWFMEKAGAHCMNAALHAWDITPEIPEGANAVEAPAADDEWGDAAFYHRMARAGDWIHSRYKPDTVALTEEARALCQALLFIEENRAEYVRDIVPMSEQVLETFEAAYRTVRSFAPMPEDASR